MIDLEKLRARASGLPDSDGAIGPTWCTPTEVLELLDHIAALEKDAGRLDFLETPQKDGQGLRYEVNCLVVNGVNKYSIYDDDDECFLSNGEWSSTTRHAIDTAMENKHG